MTSITTQLLAVLSGGAIAGIAVAALAVGLAAGVAGYMYYYKRKVGTAKSEADKLKAEAAKLSKTLRSRQKPLVKKPCSKQKKKSIVFARKSIRKQKKEKQSIRKPNNVFNPKNRTLTKGRRIG